MSGTDSERLVRIETKLDAIAEGIKDHETRLRTLESWRGKVIGVAGAIGAVSGIAAEKLLPFLSILPR